ncbi:heavy metal-associated isoprenylated plant protein 7-like isoform X2 [Andrographis paniculata]|uniref:heavy metal-associated isoprenylated plant protein 7-like isoform X2 n=1 Tax=Andrographis paniculata TaxID=175694 RepID=UPI0021E8F37B|nr:heavy metal-associated isoprenylated plant protein 7-like isoform X2 [Andrographis paniculata]
MGEEEKKPEEAQKAAAEEAPKDEKPVEEKKPEESQAAPPPPPPPPQEIVLRVYMHCEGCARKVRRCLRGFEGVEDVITDCKASKVIVKGEKADPLKVLDRVQRKSHRQVELISPIPPPPPPEEPKKPEEKEVAKVEEKKEEPPVITVVLGVYMHCEACAQEIKKRILRMKGVESAEPDLKSSQVIVKGIFEPKKLSDHVHRRTGKHAVIIKVEPEKKEEEEKEKEKGKEDKKTEEGEKDSAAAKKGEEETAAKDSGGADNPPAKPEADGGDESKLELKKNETYYFHPQSYLQLGDPQRYAHEYYAYPPQIFSDENPNACSVM